MRFFSDIESFISGTRPAHINVETHSSTVKKLQSCASIVLVDAKRCRLGTESTFFLVPVSFRKNTNNVVYKAEIFSVFKNFYCSLPMISTMNANREIFSENALMVLLCYPPATSPLPHRFLNLTCVLTIVFF